MSFAVKHRLIEASELISEDLEWVYLVQETLAGERCILPLLEGLVGDMRLPEGLRKVLRLQMDEEADHVQRYERIFGGKNYLGSGYEVDFADFVNGTHSLSLKLFSLQAILESISLGALKYRLSAFTESPSQLDDVQILADEEGHVRFGMAFLGHLQDIEGSFSAQHFHDIAHKANGIFARHFNGQAISDFMARNFAKKNVSSLAIEQSAGMKVFRGLSARTIVSVKNEFIRRYFLAQVQRSNRKTGLIE